MTIRDQPRIANNGVLPAGFRYAGIACGIKPSGKPDLSLIATDRPVAAAGLYTQNQIVAAPVGLCRQRTPSAAIRAVVTNSGNANACTGQQGFADAQEMCDRVARCLGCRTEEVLVMSTGVIGELLPMPKIRQGIESAVDALGAGQCDFDRCADAILTTDRDRKTVTRVVQCGGTAYTVAAMAKGAGMIAPNMATMLSTILTDAPLSPNAATAVLKTAAQQSFNRVSVDGHTSTNDTLLLLASGHDDPLAGAALDEFTEQLCTVAVELAKMLVADGEGASHVMSIRVLGAADDPAALTIAKTVAASQLVKTAITGGDPNWGRIVSAAGYANAKINPKKSH